MTPPTTMRRTGFRLAPGGQQRARARSRRRSDAAPWGYRNFIRVPSPAARMMTAAGRLTLTWRCSSVAAPRMPGSRSPVCAVMARADPAAHLVHQCARPDTRKDYRPVQPRRRGFGWGEVPAQRKRSEGPPQAARPARRTLSARMFPARPVFCRYRPASNSNMDSIRLASDPKTSSDFPLTSYGSGPSLCAAPDDPAGRSREILGIGSKPDAERGTAG